MTETKKPKGFALLSPSRRSEIGSMGGQSVKPENRAFSVNTGLASKAGRLGGLAKKRALTDREGGQ